MAVTVFAVMAVLAGVWSAVTYQVVSNALVDSLPAHFRDGLSSKFAIPAYALHVSTPLDLQWRYATSQTGGCVAMLCFALACYFGGRVDGTVLASLGSLAIAYSTIQCWKTYLANRSRSLAGHDREE